MQGRIPEIAKVNHRLVPIALIALAACAALSRGPRPNSRQLGTFEYRASIVGREETGTFTILPDTVSIDSDDEMCRAQHQVVQYSGGPYWFDCTGAPGVRSLMIFVDVLKPYRASWVATMTVTRTRRTCVEYYPA